MLVMTSLVSGLLQQALPILQDTLLWQEDSEPDCYQNALDIAESQPKGMENAGACAIRRFTLA